MGEAQDGILTSFILLPVVMLLASVLGVLPPRVNLVDMGSEGWMDAFLSITGGGKDARKETL